MSVRKATTTPSKMVKKPFCKVCKDAGKSIDMYTNHNIRDTHKKVVCPTLLNQSCYHCTGLGHTPKYCPQRKKEEKNSRRHNYHNKAQYDSHKKHAQQDDNAQSYFGVLEEVVLEEAKKEKEVLCVPAVVEPKTKNYPNSYANVLKSQKKPSQEEVVVHEPVAAKSYMTITKTKPNVQTCEASPPAVPIVFTPLHLRVPRISRVMNWADDMSDSEDEDEEEDDDLYCSE